MRGYDWRMQNGWPGIRGGARWRPSTRAGGGAQGGKASRRCVALRAAVPPEPCGHAAISAGACAVWPAGMSLPASRGADHRLGSTTAAAGWRTAKWPVGVRGTAWASSLIPLSSP
jgi:hypothetical protein